MRKQSEFEPDASEDWLRDWREGRNSPYQTGSTLDIGWRFGREMYRNDQKAANPVGHLGEAETAKEEAPLHAAAALKLSSSQSVTALTNARKPMASTMQVGSSTEPNDGVDSSFSDPYGVRTRRPTADQIPPSQPSALLPAVARVSGGSPHRWDEGGLAIDKVRYEGESGGPNGKGSQDRFPHRDGAAAPTFEVSDDTRSDAPLSEYADSSDEKGASPIVNKAQDRIDVILRGDRATFEIKNETSPFPWGFGARVRTRESGYGTESGYTATGVRRS